MYVLKCQITKCYKYQSSSQIIAARCHFDEIILLVEIRQLTLMDMIKPGIESNHPIFQELGNVKLLKSLQFNQRNHFEEYLKERRLQTISSVLAPKTPRSATGRRQRLCKTLYINVDLVIILKVVTMCFFSSTVKVWLGLWLGLTEYYINT